MCGLQVECGGLLAIEERGRDLQARQRSKSALITADSLRHRRSPPFLILHNVPNVIEWNYRDRRLVSVFPKQQYVVLWVHLIGFDLDRCLITFEINGKTHNNYCPFLLLVLTNRPTSLLPPPLSLDCRPERRERDAEFSSDVSPSNRPPPRWPRGWTLRAGEHKPIVHFRQLSFCPSMAGYPVRKDLWRHDENAPRS